MLTRKEILGLKLIFKKVKGEHIEYPELKKFLKDHMNLNEKMAFEYAYLYDNNFVEDGNFESVGEVDRMSYEDYMDNLSEEIKALMKYTEDEDPENYEIMDSYSYLEVIEHDSTKYYVYSSWDKVESKAYDYLDYLCDDPGEHLESYLYMTDTDKRILASDESENFGDNLSDSDIIDLGDIQDKIDEIKETAEKVESLKEKIDELQEKLDELEDEENQEEKERIESERDELQDQLDNLEEVDDVDEKIENLIEETKDQLKSDKYDEIYEELDNDFISYFIDNGFYNNIRDLIRNGPVDFDCGDVKNDYMADMSYDDIADAMGYTWIDKIEVDGTTYYILAEQ